MARYSPLEDPLTWDKIGRPGIDPTNADMAYIIANYRG